MAYVFICTGFVVLAFLNTYFRMDMPEREALRYVGEQAQGVEMLVISEDSKSRYSTEYTVKIKRINEEEVDIKAKLVCGFEGRAECFDSIFAAGELEYFEGDEATLLYVYVDDAKNARFISSGDAPLYQKAVAYGAEGMLIAVSEIRSRVSEYITELYGERAGGLAVGLIMNDKSGIAPEDIRDFRRSGVSHLLAVSGLHVSLLLGAIELLLRKLFLPKSVRCIFLSISAVALLVLSGFSMSACRSVFMLFILYLNYMLMEENDSPTSLFFAVFVIVLVDPYSIYDLGLLMSFLATLGLVTVYPLLENKIGSFFYTRLPRNVFFSLLKKILLGISITLVANIFLLPVMWYVFGEISLVSPIVNIIISPVVSLLMPCIALGAVLGGVPLVNELFAVAVNLLTYVMTEIIEFFSSFDAATVSLRYSFAEYIIYAFVAFGILFMIIKLKRKWIIAIPPIAAALSFCVGLAIYNYTTTPMLYYCKAYNNTAFISVDEGKANIIDASGGGILFYRDIVNEARENTAVSIDTVVIGRVRYRHISSIEYLVSSNIVERILLPRPQDMDGGSAEICWDIYDIAVEHGAEVILYDIKEVIEIAENISFAVTDVEMSGKDNKDRETVDIVMSYNDKIIYYGNTVSTENEALLIEKSDIFIVGEGFSFADGKVPDTQSDKRIIISPLGKKVTIPLDIIAE
jgi:competence protein ComEC